MASPDATPYIDLRLLDVDTQTLFESALENLLSYLPEWVPREGHTEVLLLESFAIEVAEAVFAINRLPGALVEAVLLLYGIERDLGAPPTATFQFTVADAGGHVIPAETRIGLPVDLASGDVLVFSTDAPLQVPAGQLTGTVTATADQNTIVANGTQAGSYIELIDSVAVVEQVALVSAVGGGAQVEDDESWFTRGVQRFARLSETLVLPRHFTAAALEYSAVERAFTLDNTQPSDADPGLSPGHVTVSVYGDGAPITAPTKALLQAALDDAAQANLAVHLVDPTLTPVDVATTVTPSPGYSAATVEANVEAALAAYLSPATWSWSSTVYRNELIALIDRVEGVDRVVALDSPATDTALGGLAPLASFGTATVTVQV